MAGYKRKRGQDAWYLEVYCGSDFQGKPIRYSKTVHCKSEKEADRELARFYTECEDGNISRQDSTLLSSFADYWYTEYAERFLKKSSRSGARTAIKIWIQPTIGKKKVAKVTRMDVQSWINHLSDNGLSPKTIRNYYSTLRTIMDYAIDMDLIGDTPCRNIRLPKKVKPEAKYFDADQVTTLLAALNKLPAEEQKYKVAVLMLLFGGLRKGEILGLNWEDVDFDQRRIHVHRNRLLGRDGIVYEDTPKTASSVRYVTLPAEVMAEARKMKTAQTETRLRLGSKYATTDAMLQGDAGNPLHPQMLQRWFRRFTEANNLPQIGLHGLRHTHASMLAHMDIDKVQISERLGHSELSTTMNIYTHLFEDASSKIADDLSAQYLSSKR